MMMLFIWNWLSKVSKFHETSKPKFKWLSIVSWSWLPWRQECKINTGMHHKITTILNYASYLLYMPVAGLPTLREKKYVGFASSWQRSLENNLKGRGGRVPLRKVEYFDSENLNWLIFLNSESIFSLFITSNLYK